MAGCDSGPKTVPAEGTLTLKNAPLDGASILVMYPDGNSATGSSDKDGKFSLTYLGRNGAMPGTDLKVGITKQENSGESFADESANTGPPKTKEEADAMMKKAMERMAAMQKKQEADRKAGVQPKSLVDSKYGNPETSGLKVTIPPGGSKELKIDVP